MKKPWHSFSIEKTLKELKTNKKGLSQKEAEKRLKKFGPNKLPEKLSYSKTGLFLNQLKSPLIYILLIAGLVTFFLKEYIDMAVILGAVFLNSAIGFFQENKASQVLSKLKKLVKNKAVVIRDSEQKEIDSVQLVVGDIITLKPGDKAEADCRLLEVNNIKVNEAILTGEWLATDKHTRILDEKTPLADQNNMLFMGTTIEEGWAKAVVCAIGPQTELGEIAFLVEKTKERKTPLQKKLTHLGKIIGAVIGFITLLILVIGLLSGHRFSEMFMTSVAVAVAAIPEGLPVTMTVILAVGTQRILKKKGLARVLSAVETLGSTSVICTDKTGSLTKGKMQVDKIIAPKKKLVFKIIALCNEAFVENPKEATENWTIRGRPTDRALLLAAFQSGLDKKELERNWPRLLILPFDSKRKFMATLHKKGKSNNCFLNIIGAPEKILEKSISLETNNQVKKLTLIKFKELKEEYEKLNRQGFRVLAAGYKKFANLDEFSPNRQNYKSGESNFYDIRDGFANIRDIVFAGFIALKDPLRPETKEAIRLCRAAGLKPIIVTGDHRLTAQAVAKELNLPAQKENILEGHQLDLISDEELKNKVKKIEIYARVDPKHKMRIIEAWQSQGQVVAMTGDGVNDAPALKKADIGIALGSGTDAAKEASDLILLNDNFNVIVAAIEEGRVILDNLKKVIVYLLADSFSEVILIGGVLLLNASLFFNDLPMPLIPAQILWVNLIADSLPNMALAFEPKEKDVMRRQPQRVKTHLLDRKIKTLILIMGLVTSFILFALFLWLFKNSNDLPYIRTIIFAALGIDSLFYVFSCKGLTRPIWQINPFSNKYLIWAVLVGFIMLGLAIYLPIFQTLLRTVPIGIKELLILFAVGLINIAAIEIIKWQLFMARK